MTKPLSLYMTAVFGQSSISSSRITVEHSGKFTLTRADVADALIAFAEEVMSKLPEDKDTDLDGELGVPQPRGERALREEVE